MRSDIPARDDAVFELSDQERTRNIEQVRSLLRRQLDQQVAQWVKAKWMQAA